MTRKKLYVEQAMVERTAEARLHLIEKIREFSDHLKSEGITLSQKILHDFLQEGYPAIQKILITEAQKNLKKLKISGTLVSESMKAEAGSIASQFEKYYQWILDAQMKAHVSAEQVTIENGIPVLTDAEKKAIEEQFTCYLEEEDTELYTKLQEFVKGYNELFGYLSEKNLGLDTHLVGALQENNHIMVEPGVYEIRNDTLFIGEGAIEVDGDVQNRIAVNPKYFKK
ncbi:hypothetical protein ACFLTA_02485 [Bacteroidota bacterium]